MALLAEECCTLPPTGMAAAASTNLPVRLTTSMLDDGE